MSLFSKIRGTIETIFSIGLGGPQIKNNAGVVELRNAADNAFAVTRGATPVGVSDLTTKAYVDGTVTTGAVREIRFVTNNTASQSSATSIPANALIVSGRLSVTTPYSAGATISLGRTGSTSLIMATTDNDPLTANMYVVDQDTAFGASPLPLLVTVGGSPAAGAGVAIVQYTVPDV